MFESAAGGILGAVIGTLYEPAMYGIMAGATTTMMGLPKPWVIGLTSASAIGGLIVALGSLALGIERARTVKELQSLTRELDKLSDTLINLKENSGDTNAELRKVAAFLKKIRPESYLEQYFMPGVAAMRYEEAGAVLEAVPPQYRRKLLYVSPFARRVSVKIKKGEGLPSPELETILRNKNNVVITPFTTEEVMGNIFTRTKTTTGHQYT